MSYHYTTFLNIIRIFSEYYSYMLKVQNSHIIIQYFWILSEYFLNLIRICWTCKNVSHSLFKNFEYYSYIFRILFVYVERTKHVSYHYSTFFNIIRIYYESFSYKLNMQKGLISLYNIFEYYHNIFWILFVYVESAKMCHIII